MATFSVHFDGPITVDHKVTIRVLSKTYEHMQRAIDRAYLIEIHGEVWKHARLTSRQYAETEFLAAYPREGGIFLDAIRDGADRIIDRVAAAVAPFFESAANNSIVRLENIDSQLGQRSSYVRDIGSDLQTYDQVAANPPSQWAPAYSNRSIIKEIDQLVGIITAERVDGSSVDIGLNGSRPYLPLQFTPEIARRFHLLAARRELGPAMLVRARIRSLDRGNKYTKPSAKIQNLSTDRELVLHLRGAEDIDALRPHHDGREVLLQVSPIIEALGFDLKGGDLMFLGVAR